jgi:hypothetical protein
VNLPGPRAVLGIFPRGHGFALAFRSVTVIKPNDDEGAEQFESNCRNNEQVHGSDVRRLIAQKSAGVQSTCSQAAPRH